MIVSVSWFREKSKIWTLPEMVYLEKILMICHNCNQDRQ
jgi:hypothetical protein